MKKPCTLADLLRELWLPAIKIKQAANSLTKAGAIQFDGTKYHIKKGESAR